MQKCLLYCQFKLEVEQANIQLGCKLLFVTNTLAYHKKVQT